MSAQDRYTQIIESLVNGEEAKASELLHEAFVEKAREIYSDLVEQDDIVEDDISEEDLEEAIRDEESGDFIGDIEEIQSDEDEIEAEEMFGEDDDDEDDMEAELELAGDEDGEEGGEEADGDMGGVEDAMVDVEDALADLKAEFAAIMGKEDDAPEMEMPAEEGIDMEFAESEESDEEDLEEAEETDTDEEELEEAADLTKVGKDGMHPADMPAGDDGKHSPVAGKNDMGGETIKTGAKGSEGSSKGLSDEHAKDMGVTHPGDGASLSPEGRGHGAEKKGAAPAKPSTDSLINKAPK